MKWSEYEAAVFETYRRLGAKGDLKFDIRMPDRATGELRQVDVWYEVDLEGHRVGILFDAKLRKRPVDVRAVESVQALADAVGADKAVIVTSTGWSTAAKKKAEAGRTDLRLLTVEQALKALDPTLWRICPVCQEDAVLLDHGCGVIFGDDDTVSWVGGGCRGCRAGIASCLGCGDEIVLKEGQTADCSCGHKWLGSGGISICYQGEGGIFLGSPLEEDRIEARVELLRSQSGSKLGDRSDG